MLLGTPVDSHIDAHGSLLCVLTGAHRLDPSCCVPLIAFATRHTFNSVAWLTWGDGPVGALAAHVARGPDSQVGGAWGRQVNELVSHPVLPCSSPFSYIVSKKESFTHVNKSTNSFTQSYFYQFNHRQPVDTYFCLTYIILALFQFCDDFLQKPWSNVKG